ncbi:ABC transporter permease [Neobacillus niacini]|uniref:ABC transporter permease n=1 Tax=Neobacillus niacini TaxID=86668 RepID=UPI00285AA656|nr:ABC transporter permease [Neobacillus niacini]MDR7002225.1 osmoprotectant transport system permease protein [Neobacillus niacini]
MKGKNKTEKIIRIGLYILLAALFMYALKIGAFTYIFENTSEVVYLIGQHLKLVAISSLAAIGCAIPLGIFITRPQFKKFEFIVMNFANIGQTVPSIAILALVMSYLGLGWQTAVFALWFSSLLPILRNTMAGINSVHPAIIDAGRGIGMTQKLILWKLELPNASYAILAGIRTSTVINVGTAALAFLIGGGGLGDLIFTGISLYDTGIMLAGALPVILLAILIDFLLGILEKVIIPKGLQRNLEII